MHEVSPDWSNSHLLPVPTLWNISAFFGTGFRSFWSLWMHTFEITSWFRLWFICIWRSSTYRNVETWRGCQRPSGIWKINYWYWTYADARVWNHFPIPFVIYCIWRELDLSGCESLESLPETIGNLKLRLVELKLWGCKSLKSLPDSVCDLLHLEELDLWDCENLESLPETIGNLKLATSEIELT